MLKKEIDPAEGRERILSTMADIRESNDAAKSNEGISLDQAAAAFADISLDEFYELDTRDQADLVNQMGKTLGFVH